LYADDFLKLFLLLFFVLYFSKKLLNNFVFRFIFIFFEIISLLLHLHSINRFPQNYRSLSKKVQVPPFHPDRPFLVVSSLSFLAELFSLLFCFPK